MQKDLGYVFRPQVDVRCVRSLLRYYRVHWNLWPVILCGKRFLVWDLHSQMWSSETGTSFSTDVIVSWNQWWTRATNIFSTGQFFLFFLGENNFSHTLKYYRDKRQTFCWRSLPFSRKKNKFWGALFIQTLAPLRAKTEILFIYMTVSSTALFIYLLSLFGFCSENEAVGWQVHDFVCEP